MLFALALTMALQDGLAPLPIPRAANPAAARHAGLPQLPQPRGRLSGCLATANDDPESALAQASDWLKDAQGPARAEADLCLGTAYAALERWDEAQSAFTAGREAASPRDATMRAKLGIMAGNAALAGGSPVAALAVLDVAKNDADMAKIAEITSAVAVDRARALVLLKRQDEAAGALAEARSAEPGNATTWLLSATLSRRMNHLADAQTQIETAAKLAPTDPEVALEAGVIAELAGREDAARKDWQSVIAADPDGSTGRQAKDYLAQITPDTAPAPSQQPPGGKKPD